MDRRVSTCLLVVIGVLAFCGNATAQWTTQTFELRAGWNAIFLEVEPYPQEIELQLEGLPIESVWTCDQVTSPVQFIQNPDELLPEMPEWRYFFPSSSPEFFATNLRNFDAGKCYLIRALQPATWNVIGRPKLAQQRWKPDSYNLVGFYVDEMSPPTLSTWFGVSASHRPLDVWEFGADERWHQITSPTTTSIQRGKAYWVYCNGASEFQGPVSLNLAGEDFLSYQRLTTQKQIEVSHNALGTRNVTLTLLSSQPVPAQRPDVPDVELMPYTGDVPLAYYGLGFLTGDARFQYHELPVTVSFTSTERVAKNVRLAVQRRKMVSDSEDSYYQSLVEVKDGKGFRRLFGVVSEGRSSTGRRMRRSALAAAEPPEEMGLWVGTIVLDKVVDAHGAFAETPADFHFRAIIHVDENGTVRLLNEVTELYRKTVTKIDPDTGLEVEDTPGRYILMTRTAPESLKSQVGDTVIPGGSRDGRAFANRISTAMFSLHDADGNPEDPAMTLSGSFYSGGSMLSADIVLEDHDPLNPFHHQFHPQHKYVDNPSPMNTFNITRQIKFTFDDRSDEAVPEAHEPGWGDNLVAGNFEEVIVGIRKVDEGTPAIRVGGRFSLSRVSMVGVLNDGL